MTMRFVFAILVAGFVGGAAQADDDPFANYYENTIVITNADGATPIHVEPDGTFSEVLPDGTPVSGTWTLNEGVSCFIVEGIEPHCTPAEPHEVGDTWQVPAVDGTMEQAELKAGR